MTYWNFRFSGYPVSIHDLKQEILKNFQSGRKFNIHPLQILSLQTKNLVENLTARIGPDLKIQTKQNNKLNVGHGNYLFSLALSGKKKQQQQQQTNKQKQKPKKKKLKKTHVWWKSQAGETG